MERCLGPTGPAIEIGIGIGIEEIRAPDDRFDNDYDNDNDNEEEDGNDPAAVSNWLRL